MTVFNFMSFATQVPVKKSKLKTFSNLYNNLWLSFQGLAKRYERIDIVFDFYTQNPNKGNERYHRGKQTGIVKDVLHDDEAPPVEMNKFWFMPQNIFSF